MRTVPIEIDIDLRTNFNEFVLYNYTEASIIIFIFALMLYISFPSSLNLRLCSINCVVIYGYNKTSSKGVTKLLQE